MTAAQTDVEAYAALLATWAAQPFGAGRCATCGSGSSLTPLAARPELPPLCAGCHDAAAKRLGLRAAPRTPHGALRRWPRLAAHLICTSLGYFTPRAAGAALLAHRDLKPYPCEWYAHLFGLATEKLLDGGRRVLAAAVGDRGKHHGYMTDYASARRLVAAELEGRGPELASWF